MIALSIRQPWPWLMIRPDVTDPEERERLYAMREIKDIENRCWRTPHRDKFLIHAGKEVDKSCITETFYSQMREEFNIILPAKFEVGGIVGMAEITGCVQESDSPWFFGEHGFQIANAKPLPFLPCPGKLQFFEVDYRIPA